MCVCVCVCVLAVPPLADLLGPGPPYALGQSGHGLGAPQP